MGNAHSVKRVAHSQKRIPEKVKSACLESVRIVAKCQMGIPESAILAPEIHHCNRAKGEIACPESVKIVAKCQNRSTQSVRIVAHGQTGIPIFASMPEKCQKGSKGSKSHTFRALKSRILKVNVSNVGCLEAKKKVKRVVKL